jgi:hypothetical protein
MCASSHLCCSNEIIHFITFSLRPDALRATQPPVQWIAAFLIAAEIALFREANMFPNSWSYSSTSSIIFRGVVFDKPAHSTLLLL